MHTLVSERSFPQYFSDDLICAVMHHKHNQIERFLHFKQKRIHSIKRKIWQGFSPAISICLMTMEIYHVCSLIMKHHISPPPSVPLHYNIAYVFLPQYRHLMSVITHPSKCLPDDVYQTFNILSAIVPVQIIIKSVSHL
jgi:hypothetical protein